MKNLRSFSTKAQRVVSRYYSGKYLFGLLTDPNKSLSDADLSNYELDCIIDRIKADNYKEALKRFDSMHPDYQEYYPFVWDSDLHKWVDMENDDTKITNKFYSSDFINVEEYDFYEWLENMKHTDYYDIAEDIKYKLRKKFAIALLNVTNEDTILDKNSNVKFNELFNKLNSFEGDIFFSSEDFVIKIIKFNSEIRDTEVKVMLIYDPKGYNLSEIIYDKFNSIDLGIRIK